MTLWLLLSTIALVAQILYWRAFRRGFSISLRPPSSGQEEPVSVIIAARNEAERLPLLLKALSRQTASHFEVLVVDDGSTDGTDQILVDASSLFPAGGLRTIRITSPVQPRKKHALTHAVEQARYDRLLFTDADCVPGADWVRTMSTLLRDSERTVLVGYSPFERGTGLLNRFARYETFITGYFTAATIGLGNPYMAVGRNIAYGRAVFNRVDGFEHSQHVLSGDDDLFVQEVFSRGAATILHVSDRATFVVSEAPSTWREWTRQKTRHTSTGTSYQPSVQRHLLAFHASATALWLLPLVGGWPCLGLLCARQVIQWLALQRGADVLRERDLMIWQPLLELMYVVYNVVLAPAGVLRERKTW
jgi:cellulose synthase/poly-beta-1,6-N-acetylglucosamine synthase-like glycosyltransferase